MDSNRSVTLLYILAGIAGGLFVRSAAAQVATYQNLADPTLAGVMSVTTLLGLLSGVALFVYLTRHARATEFAESAVAELERITWPSREETVHNTSIVIGTALGFGLLMFVYDSAWASLVTKVFFTGSIK